MIGLNPDVPTDLIGDGNRLRQILYNLLSNAVKFTAEGEVVLFVKASEISPAEAGLVFTVKDTGIGIEQDRLNKIFEKFFQADSSITREYGGTGLGLAIARLLTDLMKGTLVVESGHGKGTTFTLSIPLQRQEVKESEIVLSLNRTGITGIGNVARSEMISAQLKAWGIEIETAGSWQALQQILSANSAAGLKNDFLLVDSAMDGFDQTELYQQLCANKFPAGFQIILMVPLGHGVDDSFNWQPFIAAVVSTPVKRRDLEKTLSTRPELNTAFNGERQVTSDLGRKTSFDGVRILLAEDNTINQLVAKSIFQNFGIDVRIAGNGAEAVELMQKEQFDLVFMDIQMPQMDGLTATGCIRRMEEKSGQIRVPIVAMTAHALKGDKERLLAEGMDDYIAKPISIDILLEILHRWLPPTSS